VCADCWAEWEKNEVMVINELRLNFMDPKAADVLQRKMLEFLGLTEA
jgi:Fe-S cluster biosynthesis and repair protein YggX